MNTTNNLENFTLPKMWMIKVYGDWDNNIDIFKWRQHKWQGSGFITYNKYWYDLDFIDKDFTEITLEQFKKYVLKEETPLDNLPIIGDGVLMEVSGNEKNWFQYNVIGKNKHGFFIAWDSENFSTNSWKHARPITPKTKITRKEFESKFEIID
jgi:hypothetical protein